MKELILVSLLVCGVVSEAPAPYPPSGWRPNGPSFELPVDPRSRTPQKQEYLPPTDRTPNQEYGPPEEDVSVQGLPGQEQLPIFQLSPVNGQQYVGPNFNADLKSLEQNLRNSQLQAQQNIYRTFARQRELDAAFANGNKVNQPAPSTTTKTDLRTTTVESSTEALKLNQGEVQDDKDKKENVSVEVSKQNIQEYPPELFLTPLAQLQLQNQYSSVQLGQLRAPIYLEPSQNYQAAQLSAVPAYLAQQQLLQNQLAQTQAQLVLAQAQIQAQSQLVQPPQQFVQPQPQFQVQPEQQGVASPAYLVPQDQTLIPQPQQVEYQPANRYAPADQYDTTLVYPQQPVSLQPQANQLLPRPKDQQIAEQNQQVQPQPQFVYEYQPQYQQQYQQPQYQQPQYQQPQSEQPQYQIQYPQPLDSYQQDLLQPQLIIQDPQSQQQQAQQPQNSLQSGFDVNQQGNGIDETDSTATGGPIIFGARTQPRLYSTYGIPVPVQRTQARPVPGYQYPTDQTTTELPTEDGPAVAEATAVANGRRTAKLRNRQGRVRPVFTLDKSGHLVLAQEQ